MKTKEFVSIIGHVIPVLNIHGSTPQLPDLGPPAGDAVADNPLIYFIFGQVACNQPDY